MDIRTNTTRSYSRYSEWLNAADIRPSNKSLEEILAEELFASQRVHSPDYTQLYTFERNYISLVIRKGIEA